MAALVGCSADAIHSPQKFFPGSQLTSWNQCSKFTDLTNEVIICADLGTLPGDTGQSYVINFFLPAPEHVRLAVFNEKAELVRVLFDGDEPATLSGTFRSPPIPWDFTDASGRRVPEGDYRLYFQAGEFVSTSDLTVE